MSPRLSLRPGQIAGGLFWLGVGLFLFVCGVRMGLTQVAMRTWPQADATIVDADLPQAADGSWYPRVEYTYSVDALLYTSHGVNPAPFNYHDQAMYHADFDQVHPGAVIPCWYNPADPVESYLSNHRLTVAPKVLGCIGAMVVIMLIGSVVQDSIAAMIVRRRAARDKS